MLGPDHPDTLNSRKFLAAALFAQGKYAAARAAYDAILTIRRADEESDAHRSSPWREVAPLWFPKGIGSEPHEVYLSALDSMIRVLQLEYPDIAGLPFPPVVMNHVGRLEEAEAEFRRGDAQMAKKVGPEAPTTLRARHLLDSPLSGQGRYAEVEANERDILAIQQRVFGAEHVDVMETRLFLVTSLRDQDKIDEARKEAARALAGFQQIRGESDPATLAARRFLEDLEALR